MKFKIIAALICLISYSVTAQTFNSKSQPANAITPTSVYGHQPYNYLTGTICAIVTGTVTPVATGKRDTLTNTDTGYVQFSMGGGYDLLFDFAVTKISGTVAGTSLLQGSIDNATWHTLTGNTTYCAGCQGASATVTDASAHYQWYIPNNGTNYPYYQIRTITSGTMTATYSSTLGYKN